MPRRFALLSLMVLTSAAFGRASVQLVTSLPTGCLSLGVVKVAADPCGSTSSSTWGSLEMRAACGRELSPKKLVKAAQEAGADTLFIYTDSNLEGEAFRCSGAAALPSTSPPLPTTGVEAAKSVTSDKLPTTCLYLGDVAGFSDSAFDTGGSSKVTYNLAHSSAKRGGDTFVPSIHGGGQETHTWGTAKVYRCQKEPWLGGSIPPPLSPWLNFTPLGLSKADDSLPMTARSKGCGEAAIEAPGPFHLGSPYSEVKAELNRLGIMVTGSSEAPKEKGAVLAPTLDARGRRWLVARGVSGPGAWPPEKTLLIMGFSEKQRVLTIAWVFQAEARDKSALRRLFLAQVDESDRRYRRADTDLGDVRGMAWTGPSPGGAMFLLGLQGASGFALVTSKDPLEALTSRPGASCK